LERDFFSVDLQGAAATTVHDSDSYLLALNNGLHAFPGRTGFESFDRSKTAKVRGEAAIAT